MAKHTHSDRLERWLGKECVEQLSSKFKDFYWPIAVHGVPGNVHVMPGGDFTGEISAGYYFNKEDAAAIVMRKIVQKADAKVRKSKALMSLVDMIKAENGMALSVGAFASIDAVIAAATCGKGQIIPFRKDATTAITGYRNIDVWTVPGSPAAGGAASAAPGGSVLTVDDVGALMYKNNGAANTGRYLSWTVTSPITRGCFLLYDRLFAVVKTMNSTATEAVTGVPTRYQSQVTTDNDYIGGNFCFPSVISNIASTVHSWTGQYTDEAGNTANDFVSTAGISGAQASTVDTAEPEWFLPLAAGDVGVKALTQMQCSALVATGAVDFVIGHPIAANVCPVANMTSIDDGLLSALSLTPIMDNACLTFLCLTKPDATIHDMAGYIRTVNE